MEDYLMVEQIKKDLITEQLNKMNLLDIRFELDKSLEENYKNINNSLTNLGLESIKISERNLFNNPNESKQLILENLIDIQQTITYGIKQFITWLIKHIKKIYAWAKTSYPFYKRVYNNLLEQLVNIRKDIKIDESFKHEFINNNRYVLCYLEMNPHKSVHELVKIAYEPFTYINTKTYPMGDLDLKQAAIMLGHYDSLMKEANSLFPEAEIGITGIQVDQINNTIRYNIFANMVNKISNGGEFSTSFLMANKVITKNLNVSVKYDLNIDDCIKRIKEYVRDIESISRAYVDMSGMSEAITIYDRKIMNASRKFDALAKVVKFDKTRIQAETSNCLFSISVNFINTFLATDTLVQKFLKGYAKLYIEQLKREKEV